MYDIKWIRENPQVFDRGLKRRGFEPGDQQSFSQRLISIDELRRARIRVLESFQADRNAASKLIGEAKKKNDEKLAAELMEKVALAKESIPRLEREVKEAEELLKKELSEIPNLPLDDVPDGKDEHGNIEHSNSGTKRNYNFTPKQHFELGEALGMMDFELAAKLSGARFVVLQKTLARLERAIGQFFLDVHTSEHGYTEVNPPLMVRDEVMFGTAQLPKFAEDQFATSPQSANTLSEYHRYLEAGLRTPADAFLSCFHDSLSLPEKRERLIELFNQELPKLRAAYDQSSEARARLWLIPTAEVPLTNLVRESIVAEDELPMRLTACTPCFRAEAGAAGKDTRGMIRQHQFTKVELVSITTPEKSRDEHDRMLSCAEAVLKKLDLPYRVMTLCTGDMGFASQKTHDIEVWLPGQNMYREISSCSVCGDFQARRMNARFRGRDGKPQFVHTLNGSGVAVGRALIAVMENYQQENGAITVPDALLPYMGGVKVIERAT
jgi:seryl-tRNA synthetase